MKITAIASLSVIALALTAAGGYGLGQRSHSTAQAAATPTGSAPSAPKVHKLLYYRNPMGLADTSPTPKQDSMGMDYIAVYEGEDDAATNGPGHLNLSTEKIQKLGVRTEAAQVRTLERQVRAAGRIEPDERRLFSVAPKFEGYVERLHVSMTGQAVAKGQPLFEVYSPELVSAQREYALAAQGAESLKTAGGQAQTSMQQLAQSSLTRLRNWDISEAQVKALAQSGETRRQLSFLSPVSGVVTEKKAVQGMRFMAGEVLYQVADLSAVWVIADVAEQDIALVKSGQRARVTLSAYPGKEFMGRVSYVYPTLKAETRSVQVRVDLGNPGLLLKPGMFSQVELIAPTRSAQVTVPSSAVIDSGTRQLVLVQQGGGRFEPREVRLGDRNNDFVQVLQGVQAGEQVVIAANFLIDAESNLKAALAGFSPAPALAASAVATAHATH